MRIALLQHNFIVGDIAGNTEKILRDYQQAIVAGAELVVSSELAILGYPPQDLLERGDIIQAQLQALENLAQKTNIVPLIVGFAEPNPEPRGKPLFNSAVVLVRGKLTDVRRKALLPTYDVFDESRYFEPYRKLQEPLLINGKRIALLICEDIWNNAEDPSGRKLYAEDPVETLGRLERTLDAIVVMNGSPYWWGKGDARLAMVQRVAARLKAPLVYVNQVGGNDELVFDGRSFAVASDGSVLAAGDAFREGLVMVDLADNSPISWRSDTENFSDLESSLVLGLRDYVHKVGAFSGGAVLGLSGGIDSALVACLAAEALGPKNILAVAMPSPFSSRESVEDAEALARNLSLRFAVVPIADIFQSFRPALEGVSGWSDPPSVTEENIQSRIRGMILMAIANREQRIVLGTGNKSELAMGYATLYGDMAAGLGVISDIPKTLVYRLAQHINREAEVIPRRILEKPPSAELRPDQKDTDSLPPYEELDPLLHDYIEERKGPEELMHIYSRELVERVVSGVDHMEFKRRQAAPGLKVTAKAFGSGRKMPLAVRMQKR